MAQSRRALDLPSYQPITSVRDHQTAQLAEIRRTFEDVDAKSPIDALAWLERELLESKLPDYDGDPVLVQGDTGPGNFMYADGRVTAIVDWELAHVGDPILKEIDRHGATFDAQELDDIKGALGCSFDALYERAWPSLR